MEVVRRPTAVALALALTAARCGGGNGADQAGPATTPATTAVAAAPAAVTTTAPLPTTAPAVPLTTAPAGAEPMVVAAGDIAECGSAGDEATAALVTARPGAVVVTLGDNVYDRGRPAEFTDCYAPSWGVVRDRTRPAPGTHDYATEGAAGYFGYFAAAAGDPARGYYSFDVGPWHLVALNSNCTAVPCGAGSAQEQWLRADLAASTSRCTLAYWHHPRFSSGRVHGSSTAMAPLWQALYDAGADVVLAGHEHHYERLGPLDPSGRLDPDRGIRSFVVGTGGRSLYGFRDPVTGSEARHHDTFGVLELVLGDGRFRWTFVPVAGATFTDSGSAACH